MTRSPHDPLMLIPDVPATAEARRAGPRVRRSTCPPDALRRPRCGRRQLGQNEKRSPIFGNQPESVCA